MPDDNSIQGVPKSSKLNRRGQPWRPGDLVLDRYMPYGTNADREAAREVLKEFFKYLCAAPLRKQKRESPPSPKSSEFDSPWTIDEFN